VEDIFSSWDFSKAFSQQVFAALREQDMTSPKL
jgi:hypothetical protein